MLGYVQHFLKAEFNLPVFYIYKSKFKVLIFTGRDSLVGLGNVVASN